MSISSCISPRICEHRWWNGHSLPEPPASQTVPAVQCGPPSLRTQPQLWGKQCCTSACIYVCVSNTSDALNKRPSTHILQTICSLSVLSGVSRPWRTDFLWRWAIWFCVLTHLFYQRQPGQGLPALVQYCHGSNGQDLPHQLLAFPVTPPSSHDTEPAKHSPQGRVHDTLFQFIQIKIWRLVLHVCIYEDT